jgi:uncharacterized protein
MYFPTLVEVPIANMFLGLGMHRGPLLAYLMADPEWEEYAITNAPALVIGDLVKFVGLAPSKDSLVGALREAGME